jgi:rubrerythrin
MVPIFSAGEIFQMGVEIEKNGKAFYTACAHAAANDAVKKLCEELAHWENEHVAIFERLKNKLPPEASLETTHDPDNELATYLKAAADGHVFVAAKDIGALVAAANTPAKMLGTALTFEKDSVVVYTAMSRMVSEHLGKKDLEKIIDEELKHISILTRKMAMFKK